MRTRVAVLMASLALAANGWGTTYQVTKASSSGIGSLRWAIKQANGHAGPDTITFAPALSGKVILPNKPLPKLTDVGTTIDGDLNDDGKPDVAINGKLLSAGSGLLIEASDCQIVGLAITNCPDFGIDLEACLNCSIRSCHLGVNLAGTKPARNGWADVYLWWADFTQIGGTTALDRNVISGGAVGVGYRTSGICVLNASGVAIGGNYIGLDRSGTSMLGQGGDGIFMGVGVKILVAGASPLPLLRPADVAGTTPTCTNNTVGGTTAGARNVIAGVHTGVQMSNADGNTIAGNYFGLAKDGSSPLPLGYAGITAASDSDDNTLGGTVSGARNVFAGGGIGVLLTDAGTAGNKVRGNYFGLNAAGTQQRPLHTGVAVQSGAGAQTIGGGTTKAGNYFAPKSSQTTFGISLAVSGDGTIIGRNRFGIRPSGANASAMDYAITVGNVGALITDNTIANAAVGVDIGGPSGVARFYRNLVRDCGSGLRITNLSRAYAGNLGNSSTTDDGGNTFRTSNTWHIENRTAYVVKAEGNDFGTTNLTAIHTRIIDKRDNPSYGRVDVSPLAGGVLPTGAALALTGATALPAGGGAEICFSLSAPARATVSILNVAGRPVATCAHDEPLAGGMQRLVWSGRTALGTSAPAGRYLVRIAARDDSGRQATAVTTLLLRR